MSVESSVCRREPRHGVRVMIACAVLSLWVACGGKTGESVATSNSGSNTSTDDGGNSPSCPATPGGPGTACAPVALSCDYPLECNCTVSCSCIHHVHWDGGADDEWYCQSSCPSSCPAQPPKTGASCGKCDDSCTYPGAGSCGADENCVCDQTSATWSCSSGPCGQDAGAD